MDREERRRRSHNKFVQRLKADRVTHTAGSGIFDDCECLMDWCFIFAGGMSSKEYSRFKNNPTLRRSIRYDKMLDSLKGRGYGNQFKISERRGLQKSRINGRFSKAGAYPRNKRKYPLHISCARGHDLGWHALDYRWRSTLNCSRCKEEKELKKESKI